MEKLLLNKTEKVSILLEHQNEKQKPPLQGVFEWLTDKIKMYTEEEQEAVLASI